MNYLKLALIGLGLLVLGLGMGYYFSPERIKTVDKIVEKEVIKIVHEKFDPTTGKVIERTTTDETTNNTSIKTKEEILKTQKHYAVKVGVAKALTNTDPLVYRVGGEVRLPFFNTWAGVESDISINTPIIGGYLRLEF